jgi:hypothetical protein
MDATEMMVEDGNDSEILVEGEHEISEMINDWETNRM